ncbi:MAG: radical SAM protein [Candidatus Omnitrophica bacterium]|nr:radical SAM protein [Candidatus Omnitrophota bacterium]
MMKFPKYLSIQTTSLCNASCVFCPYREIRDLFPAKIMEEALFRKIVDECSLHREVERIILYLNNEPLTDPRIVERINYAKEKVPWAGVHILTNGSLLNDSLAEGLLSSRLDWIGISLHGTEPETVKEAMGLDYDLTFNRVLSFIDKAKAKRNIRDFVMLTFLRHKYLTPEEKDKSMGFWRNKGIEWVRYFDGPVSRAGNVSGLPPVRRNKITGCATIWANEMMHIVEDGNVVLCCMDWRREVILGNLKSVSVQEIWSSKEYALVRDKRDGRLDSGADFICKRCEAAIPAAAGQVKPKMRSPFLWLLLSFVCAFTIFYMTYFWAYMHLRNRIILGGSRK